MLTIKLSKVGKKNKKVFRIVISEKARDPYGKALEILGSYNPYSKKLNVKADRVKYWISKGSTMTNSINNLFIENKIIAGKKVKNSKPGTPNKKKAEKLKEKTEIKETKKEEVKETGKKEVKETEKEEVKETAENLVKETPNKTSNDKEADVEKPSKENLPKTEVK